MRIKKVSQTTPSSAQVVDGYSTSSSDSYSCNYVNKSMATFSYSDASNISAGSTVPIDTTDVSVGGKFTLNSNKIVIGAGVTKVKVSAQVWYSSGSTTRQWFFMYKNNDYFNQIIAYGRTYECVNFSPKVISVSEGDTIELKLYGIEGSGSIGINSGSSVKNATFITIEEVK